MFTSITNVIKWFNVQKISTRIINNSKISIWIACCFLQSIRRCVRKIGKEILWRRLFSSVENEIYSRRNVLNHYNDAFLSIYEKKHAKKRKSGLWMNTFNRLYLIAISRIEFYGINEANLGSKCKINCF